MRSYWSRVGCKSNVIGVLRRRRERHRHTGRKPHKYGGRDWSDVSVSQKTPRISSNHQKLEEARKTLPESLHREHGPADTSISDFQLPELRDNTFPLFKANQFVVLCYSGHREEHSHLVFAKGLWSRLLCPELYALGLWGT